MSRIGKAPVQIPNQVSIEIENSCIKVTGPKGSLAWEYRPNVNVVVEEGNILVTRINDEKDSRSLHGLSRSLIANMVQGVSGGFEKKLQIIGVGLSYLVQGKKIVLNLGFSHQVFIDIPDGLNAEIDKKEKNLMIISGIDKQAVGEFAANIRKLKPPEPYKGKGIKYIGEYVHRKAGKTTGK